MSKEHGPRGAARAAGSENSSRQLENFVSHYEPSYFILTSQVPPTHASGPRSLHSCAAPPNALMRFLYEIHPACINRHGSLCRSKGGLLALAALAVGMGRECSSLLGEILPPALHSFNDQDARVRYYGEMHRFCCLVACDDQSLCQMS